MSPAVILSRNPYTKRIHAITEWHREDAHGRIVADEKVDITEQIDALNAGKCPCCELERLDVDLARALIA